MAEPERYHRASDQLAKIPSCYYSAIAADKEFKHFPVDVGIIPLLIVLCRHSPIPGTAARLILLFMSIAIIIIMTLLFRETGAADGQILIFRSFENIFKSRTTMHNVINNIWLFVPLGAILYKHGSLRWLIPIIASITIELLQLAFGIGVFEVTDIICNSIGGLIGYGFFAAGYCTPGYEEKNVER